MRELEPLPSLKPAFSPAHRRKTEARSELDGRSAPPSRPAKTGAGSACTRSVETQQIKALYRQYAYWNTAGASNAPLLNCATTLT